MECGRFNSNVSERAIILRIKSSVVQNPLFDVDGVPGQGKLIEPIEAPVPCYENAFEGVEDLVVLRKCVVQCNQCMLRKGAKGVVFGEGNPRARIMFVGEGPGKTEDDTGKPFVGRAGQLLDLMLRAHGFSREEVFIGNIVKCRPPGNRLPTNEEVQACLPNLKAQIRVIQPEIIVLLGALSSQTLIDPGIRVTKDRGRWFEKEGINYLATFHPAAVLRDETGKKPLMWEDFRSLRYKYEHLCKK
jgi:uracil-DNA glycosylase family 4